MAFMCVRDFECTLCQRNFALMYGDLILPEKLICDECLKELWPLEEDGLRKRVSERLVKNASWLEEHYRWHGEPEFGDQIVQQFEELRRREASIAQAIQSREVGRQMR